MNKEILTKAEACVLALVDTGLSNQEIATALSIRIGTVKCHLHHVFGKLQARNRTEATAKAREQGHFSRLIEPSTQMREGFFR